MTDRVAVYIDFDNVVISRYDAVHGRQAWRRDDPRQHVPSTASSDPVDVRLAEAKVDIGAIIDYAASFGSVSLSRAYADWSAPAHAAYSKDLIDRALHLVQLFTASGVKNGADIRLAVDAVEDLLRNPGITHVVIVAGDSDYVPLAQSCKQLGRFVVGIGVTGSTSRALVSACDEFIDYADLPGVAPVKPPAVRKTAKKAAATKAPVAEAPAEPARKATKKASADPRQDAATELLVRAVRVGLQKSDEDWVNAGGLKSQMQRMDPSFKEKSLGFSSFRAFVESRTDRVETREENQRLMVRMR